MKSKKIVALICIAVLALTLMAGCGDNSATSTPAASSSGSQASSSSNPSDSDVVYTLKLHHHQNPGSAGDDVVNEWVSEIEAATDGRVQFEVYGAQTLGKATDAYDMVVNKICDVSWGFIPNFAGQFPITEGISLPMMNITSAKQGSLALQALFEENADLQAEYSDVHVLFFHVHDPGYIGLTKSATTAEELAGRQIRVQGDGQTQMIQALGATAVPVTLPDLYDSLSKGVVEGYALGLEGFKSFNLKEVTNYLLECGYYVGAFWMVMNQDTWDSLPADIQEVFNEYSGAYAAEMFGTAWDAAAAEGLQEGIDYGVEVLKLSEEERTRWEELAEPIQEAWAESISASGADGTAILERYRELIAQYE